MIEHHIQKDIISRLSKVQEARFSELKPDTLESNAFMYHLKQLIAQGYVEKENSSYRLSPMGLTYVDGLSLTNSSPRKQPKILTVLIIKNSKGQYLLGRRKYQPFIGTLLFPGGKQHYGESPENHVRRELSEQLGISADAKRRGAVDQRTYRGNILITHVFAHVYEITYDGPAPGDSPKFSYEWTVMTTAERLYPGTYELFEALKHHPEHFLLSLDVDAD